MPAIDRELRVHRVRDVRVELQRIAHGVVGHRRDDLHAAGAPQGEILGAAMEHRQRPRIIAVVLRTVADLRQPRRIGRCRVHPRGHRQRAGPAPRVQRPAGAIDQPARALRRDHRDGPQPPDGIALGGSRYGRGIAPARAQRSRQGRRDLRRASDEQHPPATSARDRPPAPLVQPRRQQIGRDVAARPRDHAVEPRRARQQERGGDHPGRWPNDGGRSACARPKPGFGVVPITKRSVPPRTRSACAIQLRVHGAPFHVTA